MHSTRVSAECVMHLRRDKWTSLFSSITHLHCQCKNYIPKKKTPRSKHAIVTVKGQLRFFSRLRNTRTSKKARSSARIRLKSRVLKPVSVVTVFPWTGSDIQSTWRPESQFIRESKKQIFPDVAQQSSPRGISFRDIIQGNKWINTYRIVEQEELSKSSHRPQVYWCIRTAKDLSYMSLNLYVSRVNNERKQVCGEFFFSMLFSNILAGWIEHQIHFALGLLQPKMSIRYWPDSSTALMSFGRFSRSFSAPIRTMMVTRPGMFSGLSFSVSWIKLSGSHLWSSVE